MSEGRDEKGRFTEKNLFAHTYSMHQGRPKAYADPQDLIEKGFEFFEWCDWARKGKMTLSGLLLYLGISKKTWDRYSKDPDFCPAIDYLLLTLEDYNELKLGWAGSTQGAVFWLKNKAGWRDENHQNITQTITEVKPEVISTTPKIEENL